METTPRRPPHEVELRRISDELRELVLKAPNADSWDHESVLEAINLALNSVRRLYV